LRKMRPDFAVVRWDRRFVESFRKACVKCSPSGALYRKGDRCKKLFATSSRSPMQEILPIKTANSGYYVGPDPNAFFHLLSVLRGA
jgi:hypothetical protein